MRRTLAGVSVVAAVVVACGGAWWAMDAAVPFASPGEATSDPSLPSALPLPDGIWAETGPGWVLATYRAEASGGADHIVGPQVVYLVAPSGERYQVAELPREPAIRLEAWVAGATTATVLPGAWDSSGTWSGSDWSTLSLTTGEVRSNGWSGLSPSAQFVDTTEDGNSIWSNPGIAPDWPSYGVIDSSGTAVAYDYTGPRQPSYLAYAPAERIPGELGCQTAAAYDSVSIVEFCLIAAEECCDAPNGVNPDAHYQYLRRWTDGSGRVETLKVFTVDDPAPAAYDVAVARGRVVFEGSSWGIESAAIGAYVLEGGGLRRLTGIDSTGYPEPHGFFVNLVGESAVYTAVGAGPSTPPRARPIALVRTDLDADTATVLFPYPVAGGLGGLGGGDLTLEQSLTSYIILDAHPVPLKPG